MWGKREIRGTARRPVGVECREGRRKKASNEKRELARGPSHKGHLKNVACTLSEKESHWWISNREEQALIDVLT